MLNITPQPNENVKNQQKSQMGLFFIGIVFGVIGNLVANVLDRRFLSFGDKYDWVVVGGFIMLIYWFNKDVNEILNDKK